MSALGQVLRKLKTGPLGEPPKPPPHTNNDAEWKAHVEARLTELHLQINNSNRLMLLTLIAAVGDIAFRWLVP